MLRSAKFSFGKPYGDKRKVPDNWKQLCHDMMLRLAYHVGLHDIAPELVLNADHTGILLTQIKGGSWFTSSDVKAGNKAVCGGAEKRQFTLLATVSAAGLLLPMQVVMAGKTSVIFLSGLAYILSRIMNGQKQISYKAPKKPKKETGQKRRSSAASTPATEGTTNATTHYASCFTMKQNQSLKDSTGQPVGTMSKHWNPLLPCVNMYV